MLVVLHFRQRLGRWETPATPCAPRPGTTPLIQGNFLRDQFQSPVMGFPRPAAIADYDNNPFRDGNPLPPPPLHVILVKSMTSLHDASLPCSLPDIANSHRRFMLRGSFQGRRTYTQAACTLLKYEYFYPSTNPSPRLGAGMRADHSPGNEPGLQETLSPWTEVHRTKTRYHSSRTRG